MVGKLDKKRTRFMSRPSGLLLHLDMLSQLFQHLASLPSCWNRPEGGSECANSLRPFALCWLRFKRLWIFLCRRGFLGLSGPVVDVPVVFIEETIIFVHFTHAHVSQIFSGKCGKKKLTLPHSSLTALICIIPFPQISNMNKRLLKVGQFLETNIGA